MDFIASTIICGRMLELKLQHFVLIIAMMLNQHNYKCSNKNDLNFSFWQAGFFPYFGSSSLFYSIIRVQVHFIRIFVLMGQTRKKCGCIQVLQGKVGARLVTVMFWAVLCKTIPSLAWTFIILAGSYIPCLLAQGGIIKVTLTCLQLTNDG